MTEREIADWEREIRHAEKMQEQRKSKSAEMQEVDGSLRPIETKAIAKAKKELFWGRVWVVCNIAFAAIVIYALFQFAGAGHVS